MSAQHRPTDPQACSHLSDIALPHLLFYGSSCPIFHAFDAGGPGWSSNLGGRQVSTADNRAPVFEIFLDVNGLTGSLLTD